MYMNALPVVYVNLAWGAWEGQKEIDTLEMKL